MDGLIEGRLQDWTTAAASLGIVGRPSGILGSIVGTGRSERGLDAEILAGIPILPGLSNARKSLPQNLAKRLGSLVSGAVGTRFSAYPRLKERKEERINRKKKMKKKTSLPKILKRFVDTNNE